MMETFNKYQIAPLYVPVCEVKSISSQSLFLDGHAGEFYVSERVMSLNNKFH